MARIPCGAALLLALSHSAAAGDYSLVWSDEFDGTAVDPAKWEFQIGTGCPSLCGWGNNELQYYRAENATVADGRLTITAKKQEFGGRAYTSARMRTKGLADWTYGRFEMRAKLPIGQGIWPALWMLPTASPYGGWPVSGEIDILEYLGQDPDRIFGTLHYGNPDQIFVGDSYTLPSGTFNDDFHTFALEWDEHEIRWFIDDIQYQCNSHWISSGGPYPAPFDQPFHLLLNMAVGGNLAGDPDDSVFPQDLIVDYVRVYQRPPETPTVLFDGMDHGNPLGHGWFDENGGGGGFISGDSTDLPPADGCRHSLNAEWGGPSGFVGVFGRTFPVNLRDMTHFNFWINPDAGQTYTLELNLQDDDNGDDYVPPFNEGDDDEFQYNFVVSPTGPDAIAGGGWQYVSIPFTDFFDDNSYHTGGNGIFDPIPVSDGGNGQLASVVVAVVSPGGGNQTFRTDFWQFEGAPAVGIETPSTPTLPFALAPNVPNPFSLATDIRFRVVDAGPVRVAIYDVAGRRVRELADGLRGSGPHAVRWDGLLSGGEHAPAGVYFVRLERGDLVAGRRVVLYP
jgi:beta-glucanase (GH16 family)